MVYFTYYSWLTLPMLYWKSSPWFYVSKMSANLVKMGSICELMQLNDTLNWYSKYAIEKKRPSRIETLLSPGSLRKKYIDQFSKIPLNRRLGVILYLLSHPLRNPSRPSWIIQLSSLCSIFWPCLNTSWRKIRRFHWIRTSQLDKSIKKPVHFCS